MQYRQANSDWKYGTRAFRAGERVFREGEPAAEAYIVETGEVEVCKEGRAGEVVLGHVGAGEIFGEMALIDDAPRMASAICRQETILRIIPVDVFEARLAGADPFLKALLRVLVRNARKNAERV